MKVILVAVNSKYIHSNLALRYLKTYTKDIDYNCFIKEFTINDREDYVLQDIVLDKPDIVAFSCYIWNISFVKKVSTLIKLIHPEIEILFGGPEVSYSCYNILKGLAGDYIIEGEGEETYREFILNKLQNKKIHNIKGLYTKTESDILYGGKRELMSLSKIVFPYEIDENLDNKIVYYEASRGCPFNCKYCLSSTIHKVRFLDIERVKKELEYFVNKNIKLVKFVDRTFNCNSQFALNIWNYIIKLDTDCCFHFEISANLLNAEQIDLLAKAPKGRIQFEVGVQTTNNKILKNINRQVNFIDIMEKVKEVKKYKNVKQHLDLIAGLPGEDIKSFIKSFNDVYSLEPEEIQLGFLKVLKGSPMAAEVDKWGIKYSPYPPYEILKSYDINYEELIFLKQVESVVDKYYNSGKYSSIIKYFLTYFNTPFDFYSELALFFKMKGYFRRNISALDYYKVFLDFNRELLKQENHFLNELIKFEYLRYNKKSYLPQFLERSFEKKKINEIKIKYKKINTKANFDRYHLEEFKIDIFVFINYNKYIYSKRYLIFNLDNCDDIIDITDMI